MNDWALPTIAVLLIGYGALSGRLQSTVVTQAMVFVALGLLVGNRFLELVEVDAANQFVRHLAEATLALVLFTDSVHGQALLVMLADNLLPEAYAVEGVLTGPLVVAGFAVSFALPGDLSRNSAHNCDSHDP